ncbi:MAG: DUF2156 domain-containing protein, partial [Nakamurella sp.]
QPRQQVVFEAGTHHRLLIELFRRLPFTATVTAIMLLLAIVTGTMWDAANDREWFGQIAYGLPGLTAGSWWTPITGSFFALEPMIYLPMVGSFALLVGFTEWRLGSRTAVLACVIGQLAGVYGAALLLWLVDGTEWEWAQAISQAQDVGWSAGALACLAIVTATLRAPWRLRVRAALTAYVVISFLFIGSLADLEHLIAVGIALPIGGRLVGRRHRFCRPSRQEWRLLAATGLALTAVIEVVASFIPTDGPVGSTRLMAQSWTGVVFNVLVVALIVNALRHGRRLAWWLAVVLATANILAASALMVSAAGGEESEFAGLIVAVGIVWAAELTALIVGRHAFAVPSRQRRRAGINPVASERISTRELLHRHGGGTLSWMATWPQNKSLVARNGDGAIAYQRHAGVLLGLGDPIGSPDQQDQLVRDFAARADRTGNTPALFSVGTRTRDLAAAMGWRSVQVAQDTIVDLPGLEFRGKAWQDVRSALNRAAKDGISFRLVTLSEQDSTVLNQVQHMSQDWLEDKGLPEMGFTLGGVPEALDPAVRVALAVDRTGHIHGMTSWLPVYGPGGEVRGWTLDLMRRRANGFRPVMEFLIASSILAFQAQGAEFVSLSGAPLARAEGASGGEPAGLERMLELLGASLEPLYGFRSLHAFKTKFSPRYEPMYLAFRDEADLPRIGIAITRAYLPGVRTGELLRLVAHSGH